MKGIQYSVNRASVEGHLELRGFHFLSKDNYDVEAGPDVIGEEDMSWGDLAARGREDGCVKLRKYPINSSNRQYPHPYLHFLSLLFFSFLCSLHIDGISTRSQARFYDYGALVFEKLRRMWGIDAASYLDSLGLESLIRHLMLGTLTSFSEAGSEGKAGGLFYFSSDNHYMLKTIREDEHKMLRQILPEYYDHWRHAAESTANATDDGSGGGAGDRPKGWVSLLCRYCGLHSVTFAPRAKSSSGKVQQKKIYFVVMAQALHPTCRMDFRYDLKGSWSGSRSTSTPEEAQQVAQRAAALNIPVKSTLLDNDFRLIRMKRAPGPPQPPLESSALPCPVAAEGTRKIIVGELRRAQIIAIIQRDVDFLARVGALDYSLLLGIHLPERDGSRARSPSHMRSPELPLSPEDEGELVDPLTSASARALGMGALTQEQLARGIMSPDGKERYFFGIIDLLTPWSDRKKLESLGRGIFQTGASCVAPALYGKRFMNFMREVIGGSAGEAAVAAAVAASPAAAQKRVD